MTKKEILQELFFASPAMAEYLSANGNCPDDALIKSICGAPISLRRKKEILRECSTWKPERCRKENDLNKECHELIAAIEQAQSELQSKPGDIFLWRCCWYDRQWQDSNIGRGGFAPCLSMEDVFKAIQADIAEDREGLTEEEMNALTGCWYEVEKWEQKTGADGKVHMAETPWKYTLIGDQVCFFRHCAYNHTPNITDSIHAFEDSSDLNLPIPFRQGDIVTIDCRPFAPVEHAVIIEIGDNRDCCCVQLIYVGEDGKPHSAALKHAHCFVDDYLSKLSPLYRLTAYEGELEENEKILRRIKDDMKRQKGEDKPAFGFGLFCAIHYCKEE